MKLTNTIVIILILSTAIVLRFFDYFEIPFTFDEFSALFRLKFDNFSELIEEGVKVDVHPAGVQVLMYYWAKLFGYEEWILKLPFTIFGIVSVYLIYLLGKKWFNETVGLIASAYMASIQFTVVYSQIARPYSSGLFFSLLMIYFWSQLMLNPYKRFNQNSLMFIISASLCTYNHHFSLLFAVIVGFSGIFFIDRKFLMRYLLAGVLVFVLYIPHLNIFFAQLERGGVGWLGKPQNDYLIQFLYYVFNYSIYTVLLAAALMVFGLKNFKRNDPRLKFIGLSFVWFILPFIVGFVYSKYVSAVLQYSVLIFSFPLLFFMLFGLIKKQSAKTNLIIVSVILFTNMLTLICERHHYDLFYDSIYEGILTDYQKLKGDRTISLVESDPMISDYCADKLGIEQDYIHYSHTFQNTNALKVFLDSVSTTKDRLYLGALSSIPPTVIPVIQEFFPFIKNQNNYHGGTTYLFSKERGEKKEVIDDLNFDALISEHWTGLETSKIISLQEPRRGHVYMVTRDHEYEPMFTIPLENIINHENNFIDVSVDAKSSGSLDEIVLVASLESSSENIYWAGVDLSQYQLDKNATNQWCRVYNSLKLSDVPLSGSDIMLKIYIWNKSKKEFLIDDFKISLRDGNKRIYGLYEKF